MVMHQEVYLNDKANKAAVGGDGCQLKYWISSSSEGEDGGHGGILAVGDEDGGKLEQDQKQYLCVPLSQIQFARPNAATSSIRISLRDIVFKFENHQAMKTALTDLFYKLQQQEQEEKDAAAAAALPTSRRSASAPAVGTSFTSSFTDDQESPQNLSRLLQEMAKQQSFDGCEDAAANHAAAADAASAASSEDDDSGDEESVGSAEEASQLLREMAKLQAFHGNSNSSEDPPRVAAPTGREKKPLSGSTNSLMSERDHKEKKKEALAGSTHSMMSDVKDNLKKKALMGSTNSMMNVDAQKKKAALSSSTKSLMSEKGLSNSAATIDFLWESREMGAFSTHNALPKDRHTRSTSQDEQQQE